MTLKEIEFQIEKARRRRDELKQGVSNIKTRIAYYQRRGKGKLVRALMKELRVVKKEYEEAKKIVNTLCAEWRKLREAG